MKKSPFPPPSVAGLQVRFTNENDGEHLRKWLAEPGVLKGFSMYYPKEIDHAIVNWIYFHKMQASLTGLFEEVPCGLATLYIHPYKKIAHLCEFGVIVGEAFRGKGIGRRLIYELMKWGKKKFHLETLMLQVCEGNPALRLYERMGFKVYAQQQHWMKCVDNTYLARVMMQRSLNDIAIDEEEK